MVGVDVVDISRIADLLEEPAFLPRFFTAEECGYIQSKHNRAATAAGLYAAKEAFAKLLGCGVRGFSLREAGVTHDAHGCPAYALSGRAADLARRAGLRDITLSISHDGGVAVAAATAEHDARLAAFTAAVHKTDDAPDDVWTISDARQWLPKRREDSHKGDYGKVFAVAGSTGLTGAGILACTAALKMGSGLITLGCAASLNPIFEICLREVMTLPLPDLHGALTMAAAEPIAERCKASDALLYGCGLGGGDTVSEILTAVLPEVAIPTIIDADGINALVKNIDILSQARGPIIMTPHWMEFSRVSGLTLEQIAESPATHAAAFAQQYGVVVVLKSHQTVIASPDGRVRRNLLGNAGMATGGSGDVLSGILLSLLGQGLPPFEAAVLGVYLHALSGDMAAADKGEHGMTPSDLIEQLPYAVKFITQQ